MSERGEFSEAIHQFRGAFVGVWIISAATNLLYLTGSFFMLEVYDRVIPSRSLATLLGLGVLAAGLYALQGSLDFIRGRILVRIGSALDEAMSSRVFAAFTRIPLRDQQRGGGLQPLRDLDTVRAFLSGPGPLTLSDLPWIPFCLAICFLFHPLIGLAAIGGGVVLIALALLAEVWTRRGVRRASELGTKRIAFAEASRRNAEVLQAMGMVAPLTEIWRQLNDKYIAIQHHISDVAGGLGSVSRVARLFIQSAILGVGAYLVLTQEASGGVMIASSILTSRALAPAELAIGNWRGFVLARQSYRRLKKLLESYPAETTSMSLPPPSQTLEVEHISAVPPGSKIVAVNDVSFRLQAGDGLGVIGPSASGKSSLLRALVGVWPVVRGKVRLDGASQEQWSAAQLGRHLGYLPQDVELFDGTVADNIARFDPNADAGAILAAARAASVHEMILRFPDGYETRIGEDGVMLSAGQRQRIALARALYGDPFLVVLDEPNSNLDAEGEAGLANAILGVRKRKGIVVIAAHRPAALSAVDTLLTMADGKAVAYGPRDQVLAKVLRVPGPVPLKVVQSD